MKEIKLWLDNVSRKGRNKILSILQIETKLFFSAFSAVNFMNIEEEATEKKPFKLKVFPEIHRKMRKDPDHLIFMND